MDVKCPHCRITLKATDAQAADTVKCLGCGKAFYILIHPAPPPTALRVAVAALALAALAAAAILALTLRSLSQGSATNQTLADRLAAATALRIATASEVEVQRLTAALAAKDKFDAEYRLAELEKLNPADTRLYYLRAQVTALPAPKQIVTVDLGGGVTLDLVLIRPGAFIMGVVGDPFVPAHRVTLTKTFYLGKYEVTQEQWQAVMGTNPSRHKGAKNPVEGVSWYDCQEFITKLNAKVGGGPAGAFRLPSEAEWEYACRAGSTTAYSFGDKDGTLADYAWYDQTSGGKPQRDDSGVQHLSGWYAEITGGTSQPVGGKKANAWGLYDMHGNVWEWCQDWDGNYPIGEGKDPAGPYSGIQRVDRGGGWFNDARECRAALRDRDTPDARGGALGCRLAMAIP